MRSIDGDLYWRSVPALPPDAPETDAYTTPTRSRSRTVQSSVTADAREQGAVLDLGWLPALTLVSAIGILLVSTVYSGARAAAVPAAWWIEPVYWLGLLLLFLPVAARLLLAGASRQERLGLVSMLGLGLYLIKVLRSPQGFELHDEFSHYRTVENILHTGRLFGDNPLQPISAVFPGMEIVTSAIVRTTGLSLFGAGLLEMAVARLVMVLALFVAYERVSASARAAGIACLLYLVNQKLLFFDAQFSYESLGLPLAVLILAALAGRAHTRPGDPERIGLTLVAVLGLAALASTHHLTSYALVIALLLWTVLFYLISARHKAVNTELKGPLNVSLIGLILVVTWAVFVAPSVTEYLLPHLQQGLNQLLGILAGHSSGRQLFRDSAGQVPPTWERFIQLAAIGLILLGLAFGLRAVWQQHRTSPMALTLVGIALIYPMSLPFRLTVAGAEASDRAAGFAFIGVAFVIAVGLTRIRSLEQGRWQVPLVILPIAVVFVGAIIIGSGPAWSRLPGPYLVSADSRSIDPESLDVATWMRTSLGPGNRVAADRVNGFLIGSYGLQYPVTHVDSGIDVAPVFFGSGFGPVQQGIIKQGKIRYLLVDLRDSTGLPLEGVYIDASEPGALEHTSPISPVALAKFTRLIGVSQLYDAGAVLVYQIGVSAHEP